MFAKIRPKYLLRALEGNIEESDTAVLLERTEIAITKGTTNNRLRRLAKCLPPMSLARVFQLIFFSRINPQCPEIDLSKMNSLID
jgi:hypothetical protein